MAFTQFNHGYVSELGQFNIPRSIQSQCNIKIAPEGQVTLVTCAVKNNCDNDYIVLKYHSTVSCEAYKKMRSIKPKGVQAIDEFGRVILANELRKSLQISSQDALVSHVLNDDTIVIRPLVNHQSGGVN